jgi:hypothetical protein
LPPLVAIVPGLALLSARNAGAYPLVLQRFSGPVSVVALILDQPFGICKMLNIVRAPIYSLTFNR